MFQLRLSTKVLESKVKHLVKHQKNNEVKNILRNDIPTPSLHNSFTSTLHMAVKYDNLDLTKFLIDSGVDIDAPDSSGTTPLMTAVLRYNYRIVEFLLANNADICVTNDEDKSALQLAMKTKAPKYVIKYFLDCLSSSDLDSDSIAEILIRDEFPLKYLSLLEHSEVMRSLLDRQDAIDYQMSLDLVRRAMKSTSRSSMRALKMLMRHGPRHNTRKRIFVEEFSHVFESPFASKKYVTSLLRQLIDLDAVDEVFVAYLEVVFYTHRKPSVKLLLESEIDVHVLETTGQDMKVYLFGNRKVDAIEMIKHSSVRFNVNAKGRRGLNALHYAAENKLDKNVKFLLDNGADVDGRDELGISPLFYARNVESLQLMLESGADVEATTSDGLTILDTDRWLKLQLAVVSQVAVMEAQGKSIKQETMSAIESQRSFKVFYDKCREQIEWAKSRKVFKYGTLFSILDKSAEELVPYVKSGYEEMDFGFYKRHLNWYYYFTVKRKLKNAVKIAKLKRRASKVISESTKVFDADHVVIERIVECLTHEDLLLFK